MLSIENTSLAAVRDKSSKHRPQSDSSVLSMAAYPLGVAVRVLGERSETFLRRHVMDLLPGRTVALGRLVSPVERRDWQPPAPVIDPETFERRSELVEMLVGMGVRVVMAEYLDESLPWVEILAGSDIRLFVHAHGYDVSERLRDPAYRSAYTRYASAADIVTMSEYSRDALLQIGLPPDKVHVIHYGVDVPDVLTPRPPVCPVRLLAVGRMVAKKGPLLLLKSYRRAVAFDPRLHLDYVGDGPLMPQVRQFVEREGLASVILHGSLPHEVVTQLMASAHVFVQHSVVDEMTGNEEGLPVAILEAMAAGVPVVATRHAGIPEAVRHGETGFLVNQGDVVAMSQYIALLASNPTQRAAMGRAAWRLASDCFTWSRERFRLLQLLGLAAEDGATASPL